MSVDYRASKIRLISGFFLSIVGLFIVVFLVPNIAKKRLNSSVQQSDAILSKRQFETELNEVQIEVNRFKASKQLLDNFTRNIPVGDTQKLHWELSSKLFELSGKYGVRIVSIKYAPTSRLAVVGDTLESLNIDFDINGTYINLKSFMLALEKNNNNFVVSEARLEEGAEGGHLVVKLFAFWRLVPVTVTTMASK